MLQQLQIKPGPRLLSPTPWLEEFEAVQLDSSDTRGLNWGSTAAGQPLRMNCFTQIYVTHCFLLGERNAMNVMIVLLCNLIFIHARMRSSTIHALHTLFRLS